MERGIIENTLVLFLLLPCMAIAFWWFLSLINSRAGIRLKPILEKIYENPLAAAVYRGAMVIAVALMVIAGFSRWI